MPDPTSTKCKELMAHILSSFETLGDMKCRYTRERWDSRYLLDIVKAEEELEEDDDPFLTGLVANPHEEAKMWLALEKSVKVDYDKANKKKAELDLMKTNIAKWQDKIKTDLKDFMNQGCICVPK